MAALGSEMPPNCADCEVRMLAAPEKAIENDIVFLSNPKYRESIEKSNARFVIVGQGITFDNKVCITVRDPYVGYARVGQLFEDTTPKFNTGISPSAIIDPSAKIAPDASVGPGTIIGANVSVGSNSIIEARCIIEKDTSIGSGCRIDSGVVIRYGSIIGNRVIIQSGTIIGSDGFGNARENGVFIRIPAFGNVIIEDEAEIGANVTIDRGNFDPTIIGKGVRLDNLIHVAHNVTIGEHTAIAAQTGISGSTNIGKRVIIAGQVGFVGHIEIGDDSFIGAKAGISKSVEPKSQLTGYPARDLMTMRRIEASQQNLPQLLKDVKQMKAQIAALQHQEIEPT